MNNERASVELALVLGLVLSLHLGLYLLSRSMSQTMQQAYSQLDPPNSAAIDQLGDVQIFGQSWPAPPPRVDFGANNQHEKDAEALCYIVARYGCAAAGINFRCN